MAQSSLVTFVKQSRYVSCIDCVCPLVIVKPWFLFVCQWERLTLGLISLTGEKLNLWSRICFSRALVPAQSALWMCFPQMQPLEVLWLWRWLKPDNGFGGTLALALVKARKWVCHPQGLLGGVQLQAKFSYSLYTSGPTW